METMRQKLEISSGKEGSNRLLSEIIHSFKKNDLFEDQISFASEFYNTFQDKLSAEQKALFVRFINLTGKSWLEKKIALRMFFRGKWK
jgi:hypothetical protein